MSAAPQVVTQVSDTKGGPGAQLTDKLTVTGARRADADRRRRALRAVRDHGRRSRARARRSGRARFPPPATARTRPSPRRVDKAGYYTYRESIAAAPQTAAFTGKCGDTAETTLVTAAPRVTTVVSDEVVDPGGALSDQVTRERARQDRGEDRRRAVRAVRDAGGDQVHGHAVRRRARSTPRATAPSARRRCGCRTAGFYTYRERLLGTDRSSTRRRSARSSRRRRSCGR